MRFGEGELRLAQAKWRFETLIRQKGLAQRLLPAPRWVDSRFLGEFLGSEREHHTRRQAVRQRLADLVPHIIKLFEH